MSHARPDATPSVFESPVDELLHPELAMWQANVGQPIALDLAPPRPTRLTGLDVLCWNVAVGAARLGELIERVLGGAFGGIGTDPQRPLIVLLQEAYRADETVPAAAKGRYHGGAKHPRIADDVVRVARAFGLSIRYAPSMRNGLHRSDRGNAILSAFPLGVSHAFVLPHVRQRRVVVYAELEGIEELAVMSAHLDVIGRPRPIRHRAIQSQPSQPRHPGEKSAARSQRRGGAERVRRRTGGFAAGRLVQARAVIERIADRTGDHCLILGADLNTPLGARDPVMRAFTAAGLHRGTRVGRWQHTFHGAVRLALDHVLFRSPSSRIASMRVTRLDEHPGDAGRRVFGSDHHPLVARVTFGEPVLTGRRERQTAGGGEGERGGEGTTGVLRAG